ncbi:MAG: hypothetical protein IJT75_04050 [Bacteroidaceae bacterium]|nr:hypothetical protein [Bacteroidaceae bacterium]
MSSPSTTFNRVPARSQGARYRQSSSPRTSGSITRPAAPSPLFAAPFSVRAPPFPSRAAPSPLFAAPSSVRAALFPSVCPTGLLSPSTRPKTVDPSHESTVKRKQDSRSLIPLSVTQLSTFN